MVVKIGIVLNYKNAEKKKDELLNVNSRSMDWLSLANNKEYSKFCIKKNRRKFIPADVAIGVYLTGKYPDQVIIDYITPDEISTRRFKQNDIVFVIIYDLLEAFHLSDRLKFLKYKLALKNSNNVYPPYEYQKFINNKCTYYKYLSKKNIPVAPTYCITRQKWFLKNPDNYVNNLVAKIKHNKWESIVAKPVYGQESLDFAKFMGIAKKKVQLKNYLTRNVPKYKSIVLQEYIKGFDKNNPEIRMYFINGKYMYSIVTTNYRIGPPVQENGTYKIPSKNWSYLRQLSQSVMDSLPKLDLPGDFKSPILTRIDIGSGLEGVPYGYFVNEIEFVPSLYIEDQKNPVIEAIGESLLQVADVYSKRTGKVNVTF
uniref:ATP-grasp domain-containing protein n=1 Tax=viral metagenome TaxID=1070528 RepID=A0A6C0I8F2_9ZZZZ